MSFLPICRKDMDQRGWDECDFVYICGDAYVDHPSFGMAIITRILEAQGYRVGVIAQPEWHDEKSLRVLGKPRLAFIISAGNMDSMVNHYTVAKKHRSSDAYSPGGRMGLRPDHAAVVYGNLARKAYKDVPLLLGGVEASLRRLAHYDYWSDKLKRSILLDSQANIVMYGMGERSIVAIADALNAGIPVEQINYIPGTIYRTKSLEGLDDALMLPSWEAMQQDKMRFAESFKIQYENLNPFSGKTLIEPYERDGVYLVQNPAQKPLTTEEMDAVYELPYMRTYHPVYEQDGGIPAIKEVKFSITSNRGCFGECSFCSLAFHQGRIIQTRSHESILAEAEALTHDPEFKGYIHDVGGPTADFRIPACAKQMTRGACVHKRCLSPKPCKNLRVDHSDYLSLLRKMRALPGVKKVFIRSGIRFDYALLDEHADAYIKELARYHVSGQLRLAPEHVSDAVLQVMGKPSNASYRRFVEKFNQANKDLGLKQFVVPYLMSSHPGSGLKEAIELAEFCRDMGFNPEQVQDFYPTPATISTCIYYTGVDPRTMKQVYCPRSPHEKALQRALIQYRNPKNRELVYEALQKAGREDLIGYGPKCLIRPKKGSQARDDFKKASSQVTKGKPKKGKSARGNQSKCSNRGECIRAKDTKIKAHTKKNNFKPQGMGPNKASGRKGGIARQDSKR